MIYQAPKRPTSQELPRQSPIQSPQQSPMKKKIKLSTTIGKFP